MEGQGEEEEEVEDGVKRDAGVSQSTKRREGGNEFCTRVCETFCREPKLTPNSRKGEKVIASCMLSRS